MKFRYEFDIRKPEQPIRYPDRLLLIGSCFTENIGEKFRWHKFSVLENPNGIIFNPVSVAEALDQYLLNETPQAKDVFCWNETWYSWKHHSRFSGTTAEACLDLITAARSTAHRYLKNADCLFITFGSAWLYTLTGDAINAVPGSVAANNHKAPANWFVKRLLDVQEMVEQWTNLLKRLRSFNPELRVIFTISPVRHLREGPVDNNRSKAVLIQAVHQLVEMQQGCYYFPAYELVMDDLRDYRFYAEDLVHPNYHATSYVWEKLTESCMTSETRSLMEEVAGIQLAYQHRPLNPATTQHQSFLKNYLAKAEALQEKYPWLDFSKEMIYFKTGEK